MTFGEMVKAARVAKGWSKAELGRAISSTSARIHRIEAGDGTTYEIAAPICEALGIIYPLDGFKHRVRKPYTEARRRRLLERQLYEMKHKDTMAADEAAARLLGISYGTYIAYKETGYLETFKKQLDGDRDRDAGKNIIESNVIGAGNTGRRRNSVDGSKLS